VITGALLKEDVVNILLDIRNGVSAVQTDCDYTVETIIDMIDLQLRELN